MFIGLRGFPNVQGGVESHVEHIAPILVELGCDVHVIVRKPYQASEIGDIWKGIHFHRIWTPKSKSLEAVVHTFIGVVYAGILSRPDILHIQAIGPALLTPLARIFGLKVVVTHHGPDYDRQKWGRIAKFTLKLGESWGMRFSHARIVISKVIRDLVWDRYSKVSVLIPNGVDLPNLIHSNKVLMEFDLEPRKYALLVSRLVPEKRHFDLIKGFRLANIPDWKLVFVGAADHPDAYMKKVLKEVETDYRLIFTGYRSGDDLAELYSNAGVFVLPSSHEGLPIAMLEALSYGLPVIASSIKANLEVGLSPENYFSLGNVSEIAKCLDRSATKKLTNKDRNELRQWVTDKYNWKKIAKETYNVYRSMITA
jgi:glycosyltransferase involved in cell wall biosynthesis